MALVWLVELVPDIVVLLVMVPLVRVVVLVTLRLEIVVLMLVRLVELVTVTVVVLVPVVVDKLELDEVVLVAVVTVPLLVAVKLDVVDESDVVVTDPVVAVLVDVALLVALVPVPLLTVDVPVPLVGVVGVQVTVLLRVVVAQVAQHCEMYSDPASQSMTEHHHGSVHSSGPTESATAGVVAVVQLVVVVVVQLAVAVSAHWHGHAPSDPSRAQSKNSQYHASSRQPALARRPARAAGASAQVQGHSVGPASPEQFAAPQLAGSSQASPLCLSRPRPPPPP